MTFRRKATYISIAEFVSHSFGKQVSLATAQLDIVRYNLREWNGKQRNNMTVFEFDINFIGFRHLSIITNERTSRPDTLVELLKQFSLSSPGAKQSILHSLSMCGYRKNPLLLEFLYLNIVKHALEDGINVQIPKAASSPSVPSTVVSSRDKGS